MEMKTTCRLVAALGVSGLVGLGGAVGLVGAAGAAPVSTASFDFSVSLTGVTPSPVTLTGTGQADTANDEVSVTVDLPSAVAALIPGGTASPEVVSAVLAQGTVYVNVPSLQASLGAPWISVTLPSTSTSASGLSGIVSKVASALGDAHSIIAFAQSHHATVTPLPTSTIDGVTATGNHIVAARKRATISASLWANSSDQLMQADVTASVPAKNKTIGVTATINLDKYGDPVTITVPSASQVKAIPFSVVASFLGAKFHHGHHASMP
jgi:hypothetical protein